MYFNSEKKLDLLNHHGDSINPEFANWIFEFVSSFSKNLLISIFVTVLILFFTFYILILFFSRKR